MSFIKKYYGVIVSVLIGLFIVLILVILTYTKTSFHQITDNNINSLKSLSSLNNSMQIIDNNTLNAINILKSDNTADVTEYLDKIKDNEETCQEVIDSYKDLKLSSLELNRYNQFRVKFLTYEKSMTEVIDAISKKDFETAYSVYQLEIIPVKNCTTELLDALSYLSSISVTTKTKWVELNTTIGVYFSFGFGIVLIVIIFILNRTTNKDTEIIEETTKTVDKAKQSLDVAVFKDILTDAFNRSKFMEDFYDKTILKANEAGYLIMFNINDFDGLNIAYGNHIGDIILNETVQRLKEVCGTDRVYRTGSDEFVIFIKREDTPGSKNDMFNLAGTALYKLQTPYTVGATQINVYYSVAMVRKAGECVVTSSILEACKNTMNTARITNPNTVGFVDIDRV